MTCRALVSAIVPMPAALAQADELLSHPRALQDGTYSRMILLIVIYSQKTESMLGQIEVSLLSPGALSDTRWAANITPSIMDTLHWNPV